MHMCDGELKWSQFPKKRCKIYQMASKAHSLLQHMSFLERAASLHSRHVVLAGHCCHERVAVGVFGDCDAGAEQGSPGPAAQLLSLTDGSFRAPSLTAEKPTPCQSCRKGLLSSQHLSSTALAPGKEGRPWLLLSAGALFTGAGGDTSSWGLVSSMCTWGLLIHKHTSASTHTCNFNCLLLSRAAHNTIILTASWKLWITFFFFLP